MAESFMQWVIEDDFAAGRPEWQGVGAELVDSVLPFEEAKIRVLNATHSCIAWAGSLAGYRFIHEGMRDERIRQLARDYVTNDVIPCLHPSPLDLHSYRDQVFERFGNAALADTNERVCADSYSKIRGFIAPTVCERLARNEPIADVAALPALFLAKLQSDAQIAISSPSMQKAADTETAARDAIRSSSDPVLALCLDPMLWGNFAGDERLLAALRDAQRRIEALLPRR
jgi:D-arabinitol 4-dehydrogenase